jgi:hypothetical protein
MAPTCATPSGSRSRAVVSGALILLALASAGGCARRAPPPDLSADPADLLAEVERTQARVERVRGEARVKITSPRGGGTVTQFVAAQRPDRLRLDALDFFGNPAAALVADGGRFALLDLRKGIYYRGAASPENLARLLPLAIPAEELVALLCGAAPIAPGRPAAVEPGDGVLRLTIEAADRVQRLDVGAGAAVHASKVTALPGLPPPPGGYDLEFDRFRERGGRSFPGFVRLVAPGSEVTLELSWKEIEVNAVLPEDGFTLVPPPGARIVDLDAAR